MPAANNDPAFMGGLMAQMQRRTGGFRPESGNYDMNSALAAGMQPDETGHWSSRVPDTGLLLKGRGHPTWNKTVEGEQAAGYEIFMGPDGRYYSRPK